MKLADFLTDRNLSQRAFSQVTGISQQRISEIAKGDGVCLDTAYLIHHHTGGEVSFCDLISPAIQAKVGRRDAA